MKVVNIHTDKLITTLRKYRRVIALFFLILFGSLLVDSCSYYRKKDLFANKISMKEINKNLAKHKQFVLVTPSATWQVSNIKMLGNSALNMIITPIGPGQLQSKLEYLKTAKNKRVRMGDKLLQQLVIMHISDQGQLTSGKINLDLKDIKRIEVYDSDSAKTLLIVVGVIALAFVVVTVIIFLTKSSCPFLYAYDGEDYQLAAETFGGAIYPGLERSDFVQIPMARAIDGTYSFKIRNELKEHQFINKVRLIEAKVPKNRSLIIDQKGVVHTIDTPTPPISAFSDSGNDYTKELVKADSIQYYFDDTDPVNSLTLNFHKPQDATKGKLILTTKGTLWMDYVFGEFLKLFGWYYNSFAEEQKKKTKEQMGQWSRDQNLPLTVSIYNGSEWQEVEQIQPIGPLAGARDLVIPINLENISSDIIKIKLTAGFYFWEVDYAGIDYTIDEDIEIKYSFPSEVSNNSIPINANDLYYNDSAYLVQKEVGDVLDLNFKRMFPDEVKTLLFMEVSGYYTHIRDFNTSPDFAVLRTFREPGRFPEFSQQLFFNYSEPILARNIIQD